jgi:hypothetical protein
MGKRGRSHLQCCQRFPVNYYDFTFGALDPLLQLNWRRTKRKRLVLWMDFRIMYGKYFFAGGEGF